MITRARALSALQSALRASPICALLGPRQCGKTTLARKLAGLRKRVHLFDLEQSADSEALLQPELALSRLRGLVVIDEIQRRPELYTILRPLADRPASSARFLVLGSASPALVKGVSESLAGRVGFVDLGGFCLEEIGAQGWERLWLRDGFPRSFLSRSVASSAAWRRDFIRTLFERDLGALGIALPSPALRRFWYMLAHYHGQIWNAAELARSLGVSENTARHYLDLLSGAYLVRQLQPWWENLAKRQYKAPRVYIRDSGLLHELLGITARTDLLRHPKLGASFEGFALEQILTAVPRDEAYFWGTHAGAELDLLLLHRGRRIGFEFTCSDAPSMTRSLWIALQDLRLERAYIVYPGERSYDVHDKVRVLPITRIVEEIAVRQHCSQRP